MNKKLISCVLAFVLTALLAFSASAVCVRYNAADAALPEFEASVWNNEAFPTASEEETDFIESADPSDDSDAASLVEADGTTSGFPIKSVVICAVIGLVIALIVVLAVKSSYKPVQRKRDAAQYLVDGSLRVTASSETFLREEVSQRTIENKNPSDTNT